MTTKRRPSMRTRMKVEDVSSWVEHNNQQQVLPSGGEPHRVRFDAPPPAPTDDGSDSGDDEESLVERPKFLDGGYGWQIVAFSFIMHCVVDGSSFCFGILYAEIMKEYHVNVFYAMFVAAPFLAIPLVFAPCAGLISDIFGCRASIITGGAICTVCCFISIFAPNIFVLSLFLGFGCGFGMSFIYNAAIVIVTYYFQAKRGTATSFAVAGTGIGTFIYPVYITLAKFLLVSNMSPLKAMFTAYTASYAIVLIIGLFIRDVEWTSDSEDFKLKKFEKMAKKLVEASFEAPKVIKDTFLRRANSLPNLALIKVNFGSIISVCEAKTDGKKEVPTRSKSVALFENENQIMPPIPEYSMVNTTLANLEHLDLELANSPCTTVRAQRRRVTSKISMSVDQINEMEEDDITISHLLHSHSTTESEDESSSEDSEMSNDGDSSSSELSEKKLDDPTSKLLNKTSEAARATSSAPTSARLRSSLAPGLKNMSGGRILASNAIQTRPISNLVAMGKYSSTPSLNVRKWRQKCIKGINYSIVTDQLRKSKDNCNKILRNRPYQWFTLSVVFLYATLDVPYVCFYDFAVEHLELDDFQAKLIYSAIGIANVISTIVYGKAADLLSRKVEHQKYIPLLYSFAMVGVAITLFAANVVSTGPQLILLGVFFGICVTSNYVLQSILITINFDHDMDMFQTAYSMISMLEGVSSWVGPTVFALIRERTGSYFWVFVISGLMQLGSAFFASLVYFDWKAEDEENAKVPVDIENGLLGEDQEFATKVPQLQNGSAAENENLLHP